MGQDEVLRDQAANALSEFRRCYKIAVEEGDLEHADDLAFMIEETEKILITLEMTWEHYDRRNL